MRSETKKSVTHFLFLALAMIFGQACSGDLTMEEYCRIHDTCDAGGSRPTDGSTRDATSAPEEGPCVRTNWRDDLTNAAWRLVPKIKNLSQPAENLPQFPSFENHWETNCVTHSLMSYIIFDIVPDDVLISLGWSSTNFIAKRLLLDDGTTAEFYMLPATASAEGTTFSATAFYLVYNGDAAIWAEYHLKQGDVETYNFILPLTGDDCFDIVEPRDFFSEFNVRNPDLTGTSKSEPDKCVYLTNLCYIAMDIYAGIACSWAAVEVATWCALTIAGDPIPGDEPAIPPVCGFIAALTKVGCTFFIGGALDLIACDGVLRCYAPFMSDCECPFENPCTTEITTCHEMCESAISTPNCLVFEEVLKGATHIRANPLADAFCDRLFSAASRDNCDELCANECGDCIDACNWIPRHSTASCAPTDYPGYWAECLQLDGDECNEARFYRDASCSGSTGVGCACYEGPCDPTLCLPHSCEDSDSDGYSVYSMICLDGNDCNDRDATIHPHAPELCNGIDDNCDGNTDEGCPSPDAGTDARDAGSDTRDAADATDTRDVVDIADARDVVDVRDTCECTSGTTTSCATSCGTTGIKMCTGCLWGVCLPPSESCNSRDDDCDGRTDEDFECVPGVSTGCVSTCGGIGTRPCTPSCTYGPCQPPTEVCDGRDNNCDGRTDEGFPCAASATQSCSTSCGTTGTQTCSSSCSWGQCRASETCNHCDDDGDTAADNGFECVRDSVRICPTNSSLTQTCSTTCVWPDWCDGASREICDAVDNDRDGLTDEDFDCIRGATDTCGCLSDTRITGTTTCNSSCRWEACVFPSSETNCTDDRDNDCDNDTDCDDSNCSSSSACVPDDYCSSGDCCNTSTHRLKPAGTRCATASTTFLRCSGSGCGSDVVNRVCPASYCTGGDNDCPSVTCPEDTTNCSSSQQCSSSSGSCVSCSTCSPTSETCNNRDDDCDTHIDDNLARSCTHPTGCIPARQTCVAGSWTTCVCI